MKIIGNIPERVTYFYSSSKKLKTECYWDNPLLKVGWKGQEVVPAFCSDADNEKTCETGKRWAKGYHQNRKVESVTRNNEPISIKILSIEKRDEGGRAYKIVANEPFFDLKKNALVSDEFFFDLREDVLLDTIVNCDIIKGTPVGKFIWAKVGSQMKLVRVDSDLHKALIEATSYRKKKKILQKDLEVGGIYRGKNKEKYIFLGFFDADFLVEDYQTRTVQIDRIRNQMLFYHICDYEKTIEWNYFGFEFKRSASSFIEKVGQKKITDKTIKNIIKLFRKDEYYKNKKSKFNFWSIRKPGKEEPEYTRDDVIASSEKYAKYINNHSWRIKLTP